MIINVVILAAGLGTRLGLAYPKPLTPIKGKLSIVEEQLRKLDIVFPGHQTTIVVGHMADRFDFLSSRTSRIMNPDYATTNTAKSLLMGLQASKPGGVLWINGDVVFSEKALYACLPLVGEDVSFAVVNESDVADEEVKYTNGADGLITSIGKAIDNPRGEAVGINYVSSRDRLTFSGLLDNAHPDDFFEAAMDLGVQSKAIALQMAMIDIHDAIEVDTQEDLAEAEKLFGHAPR